MTNEFKGFTQKDIATYLNMNLETVAFYAKIGLIIPDIDNPKGRGRVRRYSEKNLIEFMVVKEFSRLGLPLNIIRLVHEQITFFYIEKYLSSNSFGAKEWRKKLVSLREGCIPYPEDFKIEIYDSYVLENNQVSLSVLFQPFRFESPGVIIRIFPKSSESNSENIINENEIRGYSSGITINLSTLYQFKNQIVNLHRTKKK